MSSRIFFGDISLSASVKSRKAISIYVQCSFDYPEQRHHASLTGSIIVAPITSSFEILPAIAA
jgi:hypothetical protein